MKDSPADRCYFSYPLMHRLKSINIRELVPSLLIVSVSFWKVSEKRAMCFYLLLLSSKLNVTWCCWTQGTTVQCPNTHWESYDLRISILYKNQNLYGYLATVMVTNVLYTLYMETTSFKKQQMVLGVTVAMVIKA